MKAVMQAFMSRAVVPVALCGLLFAGWAAAASERAVDLKKAASDNAKLGAHYLQQGQLQTAKDKLETAEKQDPDNFEVHWVMAALFEQLDRPTEAERHYKTAMRLAPDNSEVANIYATFLCKTGKVDQALPLFESVVRNKLYTTPWAAATNAGVCLSTARRNTEAVKWLDRALTMRRDYLPAVFEMADLQLTLGKPAVSRQLVDGYLALPRNATDKPQGLPQLLIVGVRAALAQGDRPAADNFARLLRRDFPASQQTQDLPQLLQAAK